MLANLTGVRDKLNRATHHLEELETAIHEWGTAKDKDSPFGIHHEPKRGQMVITHGKVRPNNPTWALAAGDIVHNLRSALDHLVCQLSILNGNDISCCTQTYFPICICKPDFVKARKMVEPLVGPAAFADIETLQPYRATDMGKQPTSNILWVISKLDIIDKHRMLVVIGKYFRTTDITYTINDRSPVEVALDDVWRPLENGAQIASIDLSTLNPQPEDKMRVQGGTEVQVFIDETGCGCDGVEVTAAMRSCIEFVREIINFFDKKFFPK